MNRFFKRVEPNGMTPEIRKKEGWRATAARKRESGARVAVERAGFESGRVRVTPLDGGVARVLFFCQMAPVPRFTLRAVMRVGYFKNLRVFKQILRKLASNHVNGANEGRVAVSCEDRFLRKRSQAHAWQRH
jgi:hypothetical protein